MRFSELEGKTVGVWGLGRETRSLLDQLRRRLPVPPAVLVREDPGEDVAALRASGTIVVGADEAVAALQDVDVLIRSPGVSRHRPELVALQAAGVQVTTATGLWLAERGGQHVIGVTGTKGKSTTATIIAHLLGAAGVDAELAGNIGRPVLDLLDLPIGTWVVLELSSYQTADLRHGPQVAVMTNLFNEHVDWHGSHEVYRREKLRLLGLAGVSACVIPVGDDRIEAAACSVAHTVRFGGEDGWHVGAEGIHHGASLAVASSELPLRGRHNALNACAALAALDAAGVAQPPLPDALAGVQGLPHRLQTVGRGGGIEWVDDSISTTPESSLAALDAFADARVVLIAGGQDRGQQYEELARRLADRDLSVIGLPDTGVRLIEDARTAGVPSTHARLVSDLDAAVRVARELAAAGDVVLLSPAAPSYNAYRNFEERGDHFTRLAAGPTAAPG